MPRYQVKDGVSLEMLESVIKNGMIYGRQKHKLVEDLTLLHYTDHADPSNQIAVRQSMMDCFSDSGFIAPLMLEAKALAKVILYCLYYHFLDLHGVYGALIQKCRDPFLRLVWAICP